MCDKIQDVHLDIPDDENKRGENCPLLPPASSEDIGHNLRSKADCGHRCSFCRYAEPSLTQPDSEDDDRRSADTESRAQPMVPPVPSTSRAEEPQVHRRSSARSSQRPTPEIMLFAAVWNQNAKEVQRILDRGGVDLNVKDDSIDYFNAIFDDLPRLKEFVYSFTPLHVAATLIWKPGVQLLLKAGADPNTSDRLGRTVLDVVGFDGTDPLSEQKIVNSDSKFSEVIRMIHSADGQQYTMCPGVLNNHATPLHTAVMLNNMDAFRILIEIGAYAGCTGCYHDEYGTTPLHLCVGEKIVQPFQILPKESIQEIIDLNEHHYLGYTVLHAAVSAGWLEGVQYALDFGADLTKSARDGTTPLHAAAAQDNIDILKLILDVANEKGVIGYKNSKGESAFFEAVKNENEHYVKEILDRLLNQPQIGVDLLQIRGGNVFHVTAKNGNTEMLRILLKWIGTNSLHERANVTGFAPIHYAASENHIEYVSELIERDITMMALKTVSGQTTLETRNYYSQALFLDNLKPTIVEGSTALHIAAMYNYTEIAELLLKKEKIEKSMPPEKKTDEDMRNNIITTYNTSNDRGTRYINKKKHWKLIQEKNSRNELPLHTAIIHDSKDIVKILLREGASFARNLYDPSDDEKKVTAIDLLMKSFSNPTQFLENLFDTETKNVIEPDRAIRLDYRMLISDDSEMNQMKVLEALVDTGNKYKQEQLLMHPLVESFLHLKWKALLPLFWAIISLYFIFVMSLTVFSYSLFSNKGVSNKTEETTQLTNMTNMTNTINNNMTTETIENILSESFTNMTFIQNKTNMSNVANIQSLNTVFIGTDLIKTNPTNMTSMTKIINNNMQKITSTPNITNTQSINTKKEETSLHNAINVIAWIIIYTSIALIIVQDILLHSQRLYSGIKKIISRSVAIRERLTQLQMPSNLSIFIPELGWGVFSQCIFLPLFGICVFQLICRWFLQFLGVVFNSSTVETWTKLMSIGLALVLPITACLAKTNDAQWLRDLATVALLMAWTHMMILISKFPICGNYVLMFERVTYNVIKILLTFSFLLIGFSISFMIQFRSQTPFDGPVSAFIKTFVMMTSEFDYGNIFDDEHINQLEVYQVTARIIFVIFLVLVAIVLMNLMVGVAVSDTNILERDGNIQRLKRQVKILVALENLVQKNPRLTGIFQIKSQGKIKENFYLNKNNTLPNQDKIFKMAQADFEKKQNLYSKEIGKTQEAFVQTKQGEITLDAIRKIEQRFAKIEERLDKLEMTNQRSVADEVTIIKAQIAMMATKSQITTMAEELAMKVVEQLSMKIEINK